MLAKDFASRRTNHWSYPCDCAQLRVQDTLCNAGILHGCTAESRTRSGFSRIALNLAKTPSQWQPHVSMLQWYKARLSQLKHPVEVELHCSRSSSQLGAVVVERQWRHVPP